MKGKYDSRISVATERKTDLLFYRLQWSYRFCPKGSLNAVAVRVAILNTIDAEPHASWAWRVLLFRPVASQNNDALTVAH